MPNNNGYRLILTSSMSFLKPQSHTYKTLSVSTICNFKERIIRQLNYTNNNTLQGHKEWQFSLWHQRSCLLVRVKAPYCTVTSIAGLCTYRQTHTHKHTRSLSHVRALHTHTSRIVSSRKLCHTQKDSAHWATQAIYLGLC